MPRIDRMRLPWFMGMGAGAFAVCLTGMVLAEDKSPAPVIVHEWGTFTSLQDEAGKAIGGINVDDEPVPSFVWQVAGASVASQYSRDRVTFGLPPYEADTGKGWAVGDPAVTMRLETPVIYIYPPKGQKPQSVPPLDVHVDFHGGVLSQYYPYAKPDGLPFNGDTPYVKDKITETTTTGLTWSGVHLGYSQKPYPTDDKVWTTPREVSAPMVRVQFSRTDNQGTHATSQAEHFLFYRGVGHLDSPLRMNSMLRAMADTAEAIGNESAYISVSTQNSSQPLGNYSDSWLVDIRNDGTCAFTALNLAKQCDLKSPEGFHLLVGFSLNLDLTFKKNQYSADNLTKLKASMQEALVKEGLYPDEASAMLRTWELSYFKSPGLRFFYIVPRAWVDKVLPLQITGAPTEITRVMVGRIELITDGQRAALARLAAGPCPDLAAIKKSASDALGKLSKEDMAAFYRGEKPLGDLGIAIPPLAQDYLSLGRFRDALIVHEEREHPSRALAQFIKDNQLASQEN